MIGITRRHALDDALGLTDGRDAERLGDNGNVALAAAILDDEAAQLGPVVVDQLGGSHGLRAMRIVSGRHVRGIDARSVLRPERMCGNRSDRSSRSR